jgi:hypothetical protein
MPAGKNGAAPISGGAVERPKANDSDIRHRPEGRFSPAQESHAPTYSEARSSQHTPKQPEEAVMSAGPSREEVEARLEAAEARTEARFAQLTGTLEVRFASLDNKLDRLADTVGQLTSAVQKVEADNKFTRWTIITVVVASVLAGLAAIWITQGNMLAAFQASLTVKALPSESPKH